LLGVAQTAAGQIPYNNVVSAWFNERRGLALGIAIGAAMSVGNGLAPPVARILAADTGFISRFFGMRATGKIYAYVTIRTSLAGAAGPYLMASLSMRSAPIAWD
jgi:hypothetical protein